jgi:hypothetical protein
MEIVSFYSTCKIKPIDYRRSVMRLNIHRCLTLLYSVGRCVGAIYESFADLPKHISFDFVVVGGILSLLTIFTVPYKKKTKAEALEM